MGTKRRRAWAGWQVGAVATVGAVAGLTLANWLASRGVGAPASTVAGDEGHYAWEHGDIWYSVKGQGAPLVLVHGVYAGASSYEFRRVFDIFARDHRVFAFDLLGFGRSAHPAVVYTPALYERLISDFVREVVGGADHPTAVIASTLGAAFTIRAAAERPSLFSRLVLIEPTGLRTLSRANDTLARRAGLALLRSPLIGATLYNAIASRASIRYFLTRQIYADPQLVTDEMVTHYHAMAHQPGARFAAASFLSGTLNTPVASLYPLLKQPILLCWGKDARLSPLENAGDFREGNPRAELRVFDCGALPQDELPDEFTREVSGWLRAGSGSRAK